MYADKWALPISEPREIKSSEAQKMEARKLNNQEVILKGDILKKIIRSGLVRSNQFLGCSEITILCLPKCFGIEKEKGPFHYV